LTCANYLFSSILNTDVYKAIITNIVKYINKLWLVDADSDILMKLVDSSNYDFCVQKNMIEKDNSSCTFNIFFNGD